MKVFIILACFSGGLHARGHGSRNVLLDATVGQILILSASLFRFKSARRVRQPALSEDDISRGTTGSPADNKLDGLVFQEEFDESKYSVPEWSNLSSEPIFGTGVYNGTFKISYNGSPNVSSQVVFECTELFGSSWVSVYEEDGGKKSAKTYKFPDYKGKPIRVPDQTLVDWWKQRVVTQWTIKRTQEHGPVTQAVQNTVVFGTKTDDYAEYPEKHGTMSRRAILETELSEQELQAHIAHLGNLNPKRTWWIPRDITFTDRQKRGRMREIYEVSRMRIKYAPQVVMLNSYINTPFDLVTVYMAGSQGDKGIIEPGHFNYVNGQLQPVPDHVTDAEIYTMFNDETRKQILDRSVFGNQNTKVVDPWKRRNSWRKKNQISRSFRIRNQ